MSVIKTKQLTSGLESSGKTLISDGGGKFIYDYPIPRGIMFPSEPISGDTYYRTDIDVLFYYDSSRFKWLSVHRDMLECGRNTVSATTTAYMYVGNAVQSSISGFRMPYNGTIVSSSIQNSITTNNDRILDIRVNNSISNRIQLTVTNGNNGTSITNGNLDFSSGDLIQCVLLNGVDDFNDIIVMIEISRRI